MSHWSDRKTKNFEQPSDASTSNDLSQIRDSFICHWTYHPLAVERATSLQPVSHRYLIFNITILIQMLTEFFLMFKF